MIIKVEISEETWARMLTGRRVEGTIGYDKWTGRNDFNAFHRKAKKLHDKLVKKMPWGWVKESKERFKVYESVPKSLGLEELVLALDDEHKTATEAIIDYAIIERV